MGLIASGQATLGWIVSQVPKVRAIQEAQAKGWARGQFWGVWLAFHGAMVGGLGSRCGLGLGRLEEILGGCVLGLIGDDSAR